MNWKTKAGIALAIAASLAGAALVLINARSDALVNVTLHIVVTPSGQNDFVAAQVNSARFKYLVGKASGIKPVLVQKTSARTLPSAGLLEVQAKVSSREEGQRFAATFMEALQLQCRGQAQCVLKEQLVR